MPVADGTEADETFFTDVDDPDVAAALAHVIAQRLEEAGVPEKPVCLAHLNRPYAWRIVVWRKRAVWASAASALVSFGAQFLRRPLVVIPGLITVAVGVALVVLLLVEILRGCGIEVERQYMRKDPETGNQYERFNYFFPSIRSLQRLVAMLAVGVTAIVVGYGAIYAALGAANPDAFTGHLNAWTWFSLVTFATVGYGDVAPVTSLARGIAMSEISLAMLFNAVVISATVSWLVADARARADKRVEVRGKRMKLRDDWIRQAKLGLYAEPGHWKKLMDEARARVAAERGGAPATGASSTEEK